MARVIDAVDNAAPAAIGLDVLLDRPTQPAKDQMIRKALSAVQAPLAVIGTASPGPFERAMLVGHQVASPALNADGNDAIVRQFSSHDQTGTIVLEIGRAHV